MRPTMSPTKLPTRSDADDVYQARPIRQAGEARPAPPRGRPLYALNTSTTSTLPSLPPSPSRSHEVFPHVTLRVLVFASPGGARVSVLASAHVKIRSWHGCCVILNRLPVRGSSPKTPASGNETLAIGRRMHTKSSAYTPPLDVRGTYTFEVWHFPTRRDLLLVANHVKSAAWGQKPGWT